MGSGGGRQWTGEFALSAWLVELELWFSSPSLSLGFTPLTLPVLRFGDSGWNYNTGLPVPAICRQWFMACLSLHNHMSQILIINISP